MGEELIGENDWTVMAISILLTHIVIDPGTEITPGPIGSVRQ